MPLLRAVPWGFSAAYDMQRIQRSKVMTTIFDAGANIGQTADGLRRYFPMATIHAFEPAATTFALLERRLRRWPNVRAHRLGLGAQPGTLTLRTASGESELATLAAESSRDAAFDGAEEIEVATIDDLLARTGVKRLDLLKMDVQGWEIEVLHGAQGALNRAAIRFILTEVSFGEKDGDMLPVERLHPAILSHGFVLSGLYDLFRWGDKSQLYFGNALYTHRTVLR